MSKVDLTKELPSAQGGGAVAAGAGSPVETRTFLPGEAFTIGFEMGGAPALDGSRLAIPNFEITGELGRGGMGVVYAARQISLNRQVALKVVLQGGHANAAALARFRAEALAVARLEHPHIVQVHETGDADGLPYFALEFVSGGTLSAKLAEHPLPAGEAATVVEKLADALAYAHSRGIVHRDLKPANVLLTEAGEPKVTDFGLAKTDGSELTATGTVMGTPSYMAPEQAAGRTTDVGPAADVYSLGAILYECLTGRPPFQAAEAWATIHQVLTADPVAPRQLQPTCPRDLETIALRCLQKTPARRYESAAALAADLRRFREGKPVAARPVSAIERSWRWCRRNPSLATALLAVVVALVGGAAAATAFAIRESNQAALAKDRENDANIAKGQAEKSRNEAVAAKLEAEAARDAAKASAVRMYRDRGYLAFEQGTKSDGLLWHAQALANMAPGNRVERDELLSLAGAWADRMLPLEHVVQSSKNHHGHLEIAISSDAEQIAVSTEAGFELFNIATGEKLGECWGPNGAGLHFAFSADDKRVICTYWNQGFRLWDSKSFQALTEMVAAPKLGFSPPALHPNGKEFALASDGNVYRFSLADGEPLGEPWPTRIKAVWSGAYSPDGKTLAIGGDQGVELFDCETGKPTGSINFHTIATCVAFHPNNQQLAIGIFNRDAVLWNLSPLKLVRSEKLSGQPKSAAFLPNGALVFGCTDGTLRMYDATGKFWPFLPAQRSPCIKVVTDPAGRCLAIAGGDGLVRIYRLRPELEGPRTVVFPGLNTEAIAQNRALLLGEQKAIVIDTAAGTLVNRLSPPPDTRAGALSPDGELALLVGNDAACLLELASDKVLAQDVACGEGQPGAVRFSPDGKQAIVWRRSAPHTVHLIDVSAGTSRVLEQPGGKEPSNIFDVLFSADSRAVFAGRQDALISRWDVASGEGVAFRVAERGSAVTTLATAPGMLAVGSGAEIELYSDNADRSEIRQISHPGVIHSLAFDATGARLLTGGEDGAIRQWDVAKGKLIGRPWIGHRNAPQGVAFQPEGRLALSFEANGARLWDQRTGRPFGPTLGGVGVTDARFTNDGAGVLFTTQSATRLLQLPPPLPDDVKSLKLWLAVHFGQEVTDADEVVELGPAEWTERWREYQTAISSRASR